MNFQQRCENVRKNSQWIDFIIMARSKGVGNITRNIFPRQDRVGAFHLLVNMIAETLRFDDRSILKKLRSKAAAYVSSCFRFISLPN